MSAGKGDKPRPKDFKKWDQGWNRIWGKSSNNRPKNNNAVQNSKKGV